ncbi:MAG: sigma-70 family RNA polymerase sigma factor [Thermogemmatispora sp.]|uniref:sigma-70 family RNA polymerase sigma factor n=1 Tax=Thermogemmatispora sp. TaxID=1968838 RepID=UPI0019DDA837|nr:sigma-70 family RNA polymerase sigma factor [Thermogemmatispora sp.]MBE3567711.1 sigma-70 family RNA polymerase sigma factor [Thermogemmatispora sp.]
MHARPDADEVELLARSQSGDVNAFNELVLRYQSSVYNVALRMLGDADLAADITQDTFLAAFRHLATFRGGTAFRSWLLRITTNLIYDHWRRQRRHPDESLEAARDEDDPQSPATLAQLASSALEANPELYLLHQELQELIQRGLAELPPEQRLAVILCDIEGLPYEEIAAVTHTTLGTVRSRIARGRARLRTYLARYQELLPRQFRSP